MTGRGWGHRAGVAVAAAALLAAGSLVQGLLPDPEDDPGAAPHRRTAAVGEPVDVRTATVTVEGVDGSTRVEDLGTEKVSPGLWLVVRYTVVAERENTAMSFAELEDDEGRTWSLAARNSNSCTAGPPGLPSHCVAVFEVPVDAVPTLRLSLARESSDTRFDALAVVDLGLTEADAEAFALAGVLAVPDAGLGASDAEEES
ncbi:hypothetical protein [Nocardioides sp. SYSU D00038]|uniref:hypothetical protein n=1 Tax=Nocardioides sp. SYSU D00038 TaxID=2812554 RepID=UPI001966DBE5|nr:hypothetical protein [Nocardioides sp. SYSU D00038]